MTEAVEPRYEFRTWARNFGNVEERVRTLSRCEQIRESELRLDCLGSFRKQRFARTPVMPFSWRRADQPLVPGARQ